MERVHVAVMEALLAPESWVQTCGDVTADDHAGSAEGDVTGAGAGASRDCVDAMLRLLQSLRNLY